MAKKISKKTSRPAAAKAAVKKSAAPAPAKKAAAPAKKSTTSGTAALLPKYDQPLSHYSPYAQHRILLEKFGTDEAGQAKVFKHGTEVLGLPESQVKTYIREKVNAIKRDGEKKLGLHPGVPQLEKAKRGEFEPDFKYKTRDAAKSAMLAVVRRNGMNEACFHVLGESGMFAFVPAHVRPVGKPAALKTGDIVMDTTIADSRAEVTEGGAEQSVIRYLTERKYAPQEHAVSNYYLHKVGNKSDMKTELAKIAAKKAPKAEPTAAVKKLAHKMAKDLATDIAKVEKASKKAPAKVAKKAKKKAK